MAPRSDRKAKGDSPVVSRESKLAAIDYGIIICSDGVYSDTANDISIGEIVRHCLRGSAISIRSISGNNTSSLCENASIHYENLRRFAASVDRCIVFLCVGLSEITRGYELALFPTHLDGLIYEFERIGCDVVIVSSRIENKLSGKLLSSYKETLFISRQKSEERFCDIIELQIILDRNGNKFRMTSDSAIVVSSNISKYLMEQT